MTKTSYNNYISKYNHKKKKLISNTKAGTLNIEKEFESIKR